MDSLFLKKTCHSMKMAFAQTLYVLHSVHMFSVKLGIFYRKYSLDVQLKMKFVVNLELQPKICILTFSGVVRFLFQ